LISIGEDFFGPVRKRKGVSIWLSGQKFVALEIRGARGKIFAQTEYCLALQLVVKLETQNGLWQDIVKAKYFRHGTVASIKPRVSDSPCWKAIKLRMIILGGEKLFCTRAI
jgi:hypothetical protein